MLKKIIILLFPALLISCEEFLFEKQDSTYILIKSEQDKLDLLNGIYTQLVKMYNSSYLTALARSDDINVYTAYSFSYPDQTGTTGCGSYGGEIDFQTLTENIYRNLYLAIINTNNLIAQLDEVKDRKLAGEAYFLRGYCYFKLARLFGEVPLVRDMDVNYLLEKPTYRGVYEFIETDLLKAMELLPETNSDARIPDETPTVGTVKALLAEVYLGMAGFPVNDVSKYSEAARLSGEVIAQSDMYGYALLEDMKNLWKYSYRHNSESIFGLFYFGGTEDLNNYFGGNYISLYTELQFKLGGSYIPDFNFFDSFPENYRKQVSVATGEYEILFFDTLGGSESITHFREFDPSYNACYYIEGATLLKWLDIEDVSREELIGSGYYDRWTENRRVTLYLLRYAQTLLTYAESRARSGQLDDSCYEMVNRIRRRANKVDIYVPSQFDLPIGLTTEQFLDSVVWERAWELFGEPEGRWFDIIRLDLKDEISANTYDFDFPVDVPEIYLNRDWYFYKIPPEDRWLNPNFAID
jgi:starch-binding outer membrane protein, SusD/RagB family